MRFSLRVRNFLASKMLKNSYVLNYLYNKLYLIINKKRFLREISSRAQLSVFDYKELAQELPFCPLEFVKDTNFYGYANSIKKYAKISNINASIEHGLYYEDNYIPSASYSKTIIKIITMSEIRKELNERLVKKKTLAIGPYIHYANSLLSPKEINRIKEKYGRILLFFPSHGSVEGNNAYDIETLINELMIIKERFKFDTIVINMFYYDILHTDYASMYEKAGFVITTAGHRYDLNFISRLKSIIELADATASNAFGTNIGFSIYLKKPFFYLHNEDIVSDNTMVSEVLSSFKDYSLEITEQQYSVVSKYWGFDCIRTPEELKMFLGGN